MFSGYATPASHLNFNDYEIELGMRNADLENPELPPAVPNMDDDIVRDLEQFWTVNATRGGTGQEIEINFDDI
jgi:hypothetical protein